MVNRKDEIEARINEVYSTLNGAYYTPVDHAKIKKARSDIFDLLDVTIHYLHQSAPLTPWQIAHIVDAINSLYWDWLHHALNSLNLTIAEPSTISPDIVYAQEIIKLDFADIEKQIMLLKKYLNESHGTAL